MKRALISVSDKTGVIQFAKKLVDENFEILSTGGTKKALEDAGINVISVEDVTGVNEMFDGRVKTLHPKIHGGILGRRSNKEDCEQAKREGIEWIDMVVVNLYPFKQTLLNPDATHEDKIENIDIGGPTMIRSAAKNYSDVMVVCDPSDYDDVIKHIKSGDISMQFRQKLAGKAFEHTANYDAMISGYFTEQNDVEWQDTLSLTWEKQEVLRYGENPHQNAAAYKNVFCDGYNLFNAKQLHGKALSYNNYNDSDSALRIVKQFKVPTVVGLKHTNPCGIGSADSISEAYKKAYDCDPKSIFGGIIAANRVVDADTAKQINSIFVEVVMAPDFTDEALNILTQKQNIRLLSWGVENFFDEENEIYNSNKNMEIKSIEGGLLIQDVDQSPENMQLEVVTDKKPTDEQMKNLEFAWKVAKFVKSNGIVIAKNMQTIGIGVGQVNRIWAVEEAVEHSLFDVSGAVLASDGFFPFADSIDVAYKAGISAIIQPGGSIRDKEVIEKANELGIAMVFTGCRHFKH